MDTSHRTSGTERGVRIAILLCSGLISIAARSDSAFLIANARVFDGVSSQIRAGAVRIDGDRITEVGELAPRAGETVIDARGLVLAPGFIDTHSHHDRGLKNDRNALPLLTQGITTAVFGQDGFSPYPLGKTVKHREAHPAAINTAFFVGHNTLREQVMGSARRAASASEQERMRDLLREEMEAGALGLSTGLEYEPGIHSQFQEVRLLAQSAAALGGRYISHIRSEDRQVWEAVDEIIDIGRETGMPVQISHLKLAAKRLWGQSRRLLERLDAAREEGVLISADVYPYEYWQSTMWVLLPERDPDDLEEIAYVLEDLTPPEGIIFMDFAPNPDYVNRSVAEIAAERGTNPVQTFSDLLKEAQAWSDAHDGAAAEAIMGRSMSEEDIRTFLAWPHTNICSDGGYTGHPRGHGAFPRVLARYVREQGALRLVDALSAMTSRAAQHMGFSDRGQIAPGFRADLVLFDPEAIRDRAGVREGQVLSTGVSRVWVNGTLVLEGDTPTGAHPGILIKRSAI